MLTKGPDDKFLKYMYKRHVSTYGYGVRNLEASKLLVTSGYGIEREVPEILVEHNGMKKYLVVDAAHELQAKGYVQFSRDNTAFWLTEAGYRKAEQSWLERLLGYLNKNPGLSIPLSLLSLVVAVIALLLIKWKQ
jgi:hypothetical protein